MDRPHFARAFALSRNRNRNHSFSLFTLFLLLNLSTSNAKYLEECEKSYSSANPNEVSLRCQLRTINSEFDKVNFSSITSSSPDSIVSLSLLCSDVLFYQSSLPPSSFLHFTKLHTLSIEHCKLSRLEAGVFDGLHVRNLTINTHNTAWPALSLDLSPGVLNTMPALERIDLSQNNIWTFPDQVFCPVTGLEYLNVSMNRLQDIGDLGFRDKEPSDAERKSALSDSRCKMNVQILDISHNRLILLPPNGLERLSQLRELYLQGNEISVVGVRALGNLKGLKILNLADNKIANLPSELFHDSLDLAEIYLQNNSLTALVPRLFTKLDQLVVLDLSHNALTSTWLNGEHSTENAAAAPPDTTAKMQEENETEIFTGLIRLVLLNLGYNQLTRLTAKPFQDLYSLQILNLEHNQIAAIEPDTFAAMNNLHTLILSHNQLSFVDATSLNGLFVLSLLSIDNNNITGIHSSSFHNCSGLTDLNINGNALTDVGASIQNLTLLKTIDLGENQIESTPELLGLPNLYGLRLTGNRIVNVTKDAFKDLPALKILNLARNQLKFIEEGAFDANLNLQALRLDANYLSDISNLFAQSPNLIWLNISDNQLTWFDYALIPKQLQWIDLHKNALADLGNYFQRQDLKLQTLDASFNRIAAIRANNLPDSLEMIFLNDNLIKTIEPHTFYRKANLSRVDIFANQIETLELTSLRLGPIPLDKQLPEMYLAGNPIICDCNSEWLQRINNLGHLRQHFKIVDLESVYCRIVNEDTVLPIAEVKPSQFLCPYTNHCFNLCECCEYNACDCQQQCPQNCDCFNDDVWATNIVDCSNKGHTKMPTHIPMDASQLYLDGNTIEELPSHVLIGRKNLQILHLNNSGITRIANNSLSGLKRLTRLHLENNYIQRLEGFEFKDLSELRELYLQNNQLTFISNDTFRGLKALEIVKLEHNRLSTFEMWILSENSYLIEINLSHNEWSCECEFLAKAAPWTQENSAKLSDAAGVNCKLQGRSYPLAQMNGTRCSDLTSLSSRTTAGAPQPSFQSYLPLFIIVIVVCLVLGASAVLLCRKRKSLGVWALSKCHSCGQCYQSSFSSNAAAEDSEKLYDAYVAYSLKDEAWVNQILANELEGHVPAYRLCLHYKFPVTAYVADTILEAVESSKRTVLVVSKNFLGNEWIRFEFKSALYSSLRGSGKKLLAIVLGDVPARDFDPDLRILLRNATVLNANDKHFLSKLKTALPDPRRPSSRLRHTNQHVHCLQKQSSASEISSNNYPLMDGGSISLFSDQHQYQYTNHMPMNSNNSSKTSALNYANSTLNNSGSTVPLFIPPFPPPNRPPPPFPNGHSNSNSNSIRRPHHHLHQQC